MNDQPSKKGPPHIAGHPRLLHGWKPLAEQIGDPIHGCWDRAIKGGKEIAGAAVGHDCRALNRTHRRAGLKVLGPGGAERFAAWQA